MRALPLLLLTLVTTGCGTMANLNGQPGPGFRIGNMEPVRVYGGVRNDAKWLWSVVAWPEWQDLERPDSMVDALDTVSTTAGGVIVYAYFAAIDLPLSVIGDTVTLPCVIERIRQQGLNAQASSAESKRSDYMVPVRSSIR